MTSSRGRRSSNASNRGNQSATMNGDHHASQGYQKQRDKPQQQQRQQHRKVSMVAKPPVQILGVPKIIQNKSSSATTTNEGTTQPQQQQQQQQQKESEASPTPAKSVAVGVESPSSPNVQLSPTSLKLLRRNTPPPVYKPRNLMHSLSSPQTIKFMNQHWEIVTDRAAKLLSQKSESTGSNEFYVVGVLGGRATGKSTLSNILAGSSITSPFEVAGINELINCDRRTRGVDFFLSNDRVIILDCEALFGDSSESEPEITSLHLGLFMYSICHVLIIPHVEAYPDSHLIRFVRTLENLKKGIPDQFQNIGPKIMFVANDQDENKALAPINGFDTFTLPHNPDEEVMHLFRERVFSGVERKFRGGEKDWLLACGKNWEMIRKNYFFGEYRRTSQRIYVSS